MKVCRKRKGVQFVASLNNNRKLIKKPVKFVHKEKFKYLIALETDWKELEDETYKTRHSEDYRMYFCFFRKNVEICT